MDELKLQLRFNCIAANRRVPSSANFGLTQSRLIRKYGGVMAKLMSKSELIHKIAERPSNNMTRKDVKGVMEVACENRLQGTQ